MTVQRLKLAGVVIAGFAFLAAAPGVAFAQSKCTAGEVKATGKKASCKAAVFSKAAAKALQPDSGKLTACETKFSGAFTKAQSKGDCNPGGASASTIESKVDAFVNDLNSEIAVGPLPSKCQAAELKAAGKKASCLLGVDAKGIAKATAPDPTKHAACGTKMSASFTKAASKGDCGAAAGDSAIEMKVDNFEADVLSEENPVGATTTTTSTPGGSTTTTTMGGGCNCCSSTKLKFTTGASDIGTRGCLNSTDPAHPDGSPCNVTTDCGTTTPGGTCVSGCQCTGCVTTDGTITGTVKDGTTGATVCNLRAGALYFGGSGVGTPLPSVIPDMGTSFSKITMCGPTTGALTLGATTDTDPGVTNRTCTSATVSDPEYAACVGGTSAGSPCLPGMTCVGPPTNTDNGKTCTTNTDCNTGTNTGGMCLSACPGVGAACTGTLKGCLFGAPLPIPNPNSVATSTCVINRVTTDASGTGSCADGSTTLLDIPLGSDIYLTGDIATDVTGIQPCPVCISNVCHGGPRNGMTCMPGNSALGVAGPTTHDCPPPADAAHFVGTLPIPFKLTTGPSTKISQDTPTVTADRTFCGFCRSTFGVTFQGPPAIPCTKSHAQDAAQCTTTGFGACAQRNQGAFGIGDARTITENGAPAGVCLADHNEHAAREVSVFCIPPSYNATVDSVGDLPSPGAVALPGVAQLVP